MFQFISKIFGGSKSEKDIKKIAPLVDEINQFYTQYQQLNNDQLRHKTVEFKEILSNQLSPIDTEIEQYKTQIESLAESDLQDIASIYKNIDNLQKQRTLKIEEVLAEILPQAFAVIKETAFRFTNNEKLVSTATPLDRDLSVKKDYITINNNQSIFNNTWTAAGGTVRWNMVHYDVQLIGGIVLHQGKIAEMATGEGKTLVSTLPAYLNALSGEGVHIVTVNDYLSKRDSEWNGPLFEWLGIKVDCIDKYEPHSKERRLAYRADITYGTNNEFGFDYLRDNMVHEASERVQRNYHFAMVDEVDSVLIDDARTPLIISGPVSYASDEQQYFHLKPRIEKIIEAQKKITNQYLVEAKKLFALLSNNEDKEKEKELGLQLYRAYRGLPKNNALIKFLSETGVRLKLQKAENIYLADNQKEMPKVDEGLYFYIDEKNNSVELTDKGIQLITSTSDDPHFFVIPDISTSLDLIDKNEALNINEKATEKAAIIDDYAVKADRIHTINQLLKAYTLFEKDVEYVVLNEQVKLIDEQTGRILEGRRYSDGLHQAIEAKENVKIEAASQTYATITLQNYFRMFHKLAGMTGTAETEAQEFWDIYKLDVVKVPTNIPTIRLDINDNLYKTKREKYKAIIERIVELKEKGQPVLVGTTSVEVSELISRMLKQKQIKHNVLNAKQHAKEAQVIAEAGLSQVVTIATNMAGRGTDIKLGPNVKESGGLAILGTEKHESRRVDRQLRGRSGRQGDPGSTQFYLSLEDDLIRMFGGERISKVADFAGFKEGEVIQHKLITNSIERAQKKVEENNYGIRKRLLEYDDVMNKQRNVIYEKRNHALLGDKLTLDIDNAFYFIANVLVIKHKNLGIYEDFKIDVIIHFGIDIVHLINAEKFTKENEQDLTQLLYEQSINHYNQKNKITVELCYEGIKNIFKNNKGLENFYIPFTDGKTTIQVLVTLEQGMQTKGSVVIKQIEKAISLHLIDDCWKEHLRLMDDLKHSVQTASYEQKDPLVIYKLEAFELFKKMSAQLNMQTVQFLSHVHILAQNNAIQPKSNVNNIKRQPQTKEIKNDFHQETNLQEKEEKQQPISVGPKIGRNDPCPCGSGKKYKSCHFGQKI